MNTGPHADLISFQLKWTKSFRRASNKEMTVDRTLTFAARRNIPVRYNRNLVATTLNAMKRVTEIRARRERQFYKNRMSGNKERQRALDRKLVAENEHLLPPQLREKATAEEVLEDPMVESMVEVREKAPAQKTKARRRLRVDGVEEMDVD